jgi:acetyl-CoA acetyltransferase
MSDPRQEAVILSAVRTPSGNFQGGLSSFTAPQLGDIVVRAAVERARIPNPADIDEVIMGNVVSAGLGQNPARQAAIHAGLPDSVGALTINKVCGSSLKAAMLAAQAIPAGEGQLFVAGGMESMSRATWWMAGPARCVSGMPSSPTPYCMTGCGAHWRIGVWAMPLSSSPMNTRSAARRWTSLPFTPT